MNKAYKYRIYPNPEQETLINKTFGCVRFIYNRMLANRKEVYEQFKDDKDLLKQQKYLLPADFKKEFAWLKEVDSLASSLRRQDTAHILRTIRKALSG